VSDSETALLALRRHLTPTTLSPFAFSPTHNTWQATFLIATETSTKGSQEAFFGKRQNYIKKC